MKKILLILLSIIIFAGGYLFLLEINFFNTTEMNRDYYKKALTLKENKEYKKAYYTLGKISAVYKAYPAVLLYQADCASKIEDEKTAIKKLSMILKNYPNSVIAPLASYQLAQAYFRFKDFDRAKEQFLLTNKLYEGTQYSIASYYYLGLIEGDKAQSFDYFKKYLILSPSGRFAINSLNEANSLKSNLTKDEKYIWGVVQFENGNYQQALEHFKDTKAKENWYYKAMCYAKLKKRYSAVLTLKDGIKNYSNYVSEKKLKEAMTLYVKLDYKSKRNSWNDLVYFTNKSQNAHDYALYSKAVLTPNNNANPIYDKIFAKFPDGYFASESLWNIFWKEYKNKNYLKALKLADSHIEKFKTTNAAPRIRFWRGKIYEKLNRNDKAKQQYERLLANYKDSYYAFRAFNRLNELNGGTDKKWMTNRYNKINKKAFTPRLPYSYENIKNHFGALTAELLEVEDYHLLIKTKQTDEYIDSWINFKNNNKARSIILAKIKMKKSENKPGEDYLIWHLIYPIYYADYINKYASKQGIDPYLALSLLKEESHFNEKVISSSNARGLMQLLPRTAKDIARWKKLGSYSTADLFKPEINIKLGTAYLNYTKSVLNNNPMFMVAAYNAGPGAVRSWIRKNNYSDLDEFIENIPYDETRNYVKKVYGSYWNYTRIYEN